MGLLQSHTLRFEGYRGVKETPGSSILTLALPGWGCPHGEMGRDVPASCQEASARLCSPAPPPGVRTVLVTDCDDEVSGLVPIVAFLGSGAPSLCV